MPDDSECEGPAMNDIEWEGSTVVDGMVTLDEVCGRMSDGDFPLCSFALHEQMTYFDRPLDVAGQCFVEVFCGCAAATAGISFSKVPHVAPWDNARHPSMDVIKNGHVLSQLVIAGWVASSWLGTPCQSLTWARSPQLRDWRFLKGKPGLNDKEKELVLMGNRLAYLSISFALLLYNTVIILLLRIHQGVGYGC